MAEVDAMRYLTVFPVEEDIKIFRLLAGKNWSYGGSVPGEIACGIKVC